MDKVPTYAILTLAVIITLVIAVDVVLAFNKHKGDTYSEVIRETARKWPIFLVFWGLFWGVLLGHWFWANCALEDCQILLKTDTHKTP
jgi:hypothetical protein